MQSLPSLSLIHAFGFPLPNVLKHLLEQEQGRLGDHELLSNRISYVSVWAFKLDIYAFATIRERFDVAAPLRRHVFDSSELGVEKSVQLLTVRLVDAIEKSVELLL